MSYETNVFENLHHRMITNGFEHGQKIRAEHLRKEFGCSASTVREALFRLSTLGLVQFQEQRGFRVPQKSRNTLHELSHLRILLESEGAIQSIRQGRVEWEARLNAAHHQLSHIEKRLNETQISEPFIDLWFAAERQFHETLISSCGSDLLIGTHRQIYDRFQQKLMVEDRTFNFVSDNIEHHQQILDAAMSGDEALTQMKIHNHLARHL